MNIKRLILEGEGSQLDFKTKITHLNKIAKTMVAFANHQGGRILVGVLDDGTIKGVKSEEEEKYMLTQAAIHYCKPAINPQFSEYEVDGNTVLVAEIAESIEKPHYSKDENGNWKVYIRAEDKSVLATTVVLNILKKSSTANPVLIKYSSNEKALLEYLSEHQHITLIEFCKLTKISKRSASRILVNLVLSGIIRVHTTEKYEFYTAA